MNQFEGFSAGLLAGSSNKHIAFDRFSMHKKFMGDVLKPGGHLHFFAENLMSFLCGTSGWGHLHPGYPGRSQWNGHINQHFSQQGSFNTFKGFTVSRIWNGQYHYIGCLGCHNIASSLDKCFSTKQGKDCLLYTSPSPRDRTSSRMPSSA